MAERELTLATTAQNEAQLKTVPTKQLRDFDGATVAFERALTKVLRYMAPQAARTLPAAIELQRDPCSGVAGEGGESS